MKVITESQTIIEPKIELYNMDCMEYMSTLEDNAFDLAIADPPYGIGDKILGGRTIPSTLKNKMYNKKKWDNGIPKKEYFEELFRVSKNQIIWGGNYMTDFLKPSRGWIFWQKFSHNNLKYSHGELAWTSFDTKLNMVKIQVDGISKKSTVIHPTQKPEKLYEWVLINYAEAGQKILDTHLGSGSSAIASYNYKFDFVGLEIDKEYFDNAVNRFNNYKRQLKIF